MTTRADHVECIGDITLEYLRDDAGHVGIRLFPSSLRPLLAAKRAGLAGLPYIDAIPGAGNLPATALDPLAHIKIVGDAYAGGFSQGVTLRTAPTNDGFHFHDRQTLSADGRTTLRTTLRNGSGHAILHDVSWHAGDCAMEIRTAFVNGSSAPVTLELLTSFSLGGITPFHGADAPGRLRVHRFRSAWSAEGRLETRTLEELHLERSWSGSGAFSERFGQVGSMPVRKWFPFVAVEDVAAGVTWGANLAWAGSWQMEVFRQHDDVCLSGGLADREAGHWTKTVAPGESLATPVATVSCVHGDLDDLCDRLTAAQQRAAVRHPAVERDLPVVFNEWATTWGDPRHDKVMAIAERLKGSAVRYLVIDAGWYKTEGTAWWSAQGDWNASRVLFPDGIEATARAISDAGFIPGLWFEFEVAGANSAAFSMTDHLLRRDGVPVTSGIKRFWDMNDPWVVDYLSDRVIALLRRAGFGYLKVDYNDTIGIGCDDPDSLGEGLRKQVLGIHKFFDHLRAQLPDLVIENCSSGGHRLEPSMISRTAMSSFSDAHELPEIPIIAANLHRLMLPRQSQIWAVLHPSDSDERLAYSLAAAFLGRMCLSGDIAGLRPAQWDLVLLAQALYRRAAPVIRDGTSRRQGRIGESWRHPSGYQVVVRTAADGREALVVAHAFAGAPERIEAVLPEGSWTCIEQFPACPVDARDRTLVWKPGGDFRGVVLRLSNVSQRKG